MKNEQDISGQIEVLREALRRLDSVQGGQKEVIEQAQTYIETGVLRREDYKIVEPTTVRTADLTLSILGRQNR
ncbi:MAG TPA: hypothetical protein PKA27_13860 [Fimbriimonadaceae bacterium]|nr:hypothetical protein [Fimbriimonadaceae bacterium]